MDSVGRAVSSRVLFATSGSGSGTHVGVSTTVNESRKDISISPESNTTMYNTICTILYCNNTVIPGERVAFYSG